MRMTAKQKYSGIIPGNDYTLVEERGDSYKMKIKGGIQFIPKWVFEGRLDKRYEIREENPEDEFHMTEWQ